MRSGWERDAHQMIVDVGPLGCTISAGHGHAVQPSASPFSWIPVPIATRPRRSGGTSSVAPRLTPR
jgi:hypothetical protein